MMRTLPKSAVTAVCLLGLAAPVAAQAPGVDLKLNPRIGLYTPLTDLNDSSPGDVVDTYKLDNSLAIGLGLQLDFGGAWGVRANLDYATSSSVDTEDGSISDTNETTLLAVVGDLMWRPLPRIVVVQPYLFAGGGLKQYDFEFEGATPGEFEKQSDPTVHVGAGVDLGVGPINLNAELGDYISWLELTEDDSKVQHDLFVMVGFSIGLF